MTFFSFLPFATFSFVALAVPIVSACITLAEKRRQRSQLKRQRRVFRPVVIQGGKADIPDITLPNPEMESPDTEAASRPKFRLLVLP